MGFTWDTPPTVFEEGVIDYEIAVRTAILAKCAEYAEIIQTWMRQTAPWKDECMPAREYLRAEAFSEDEAIGLRAWYDLELYRAQCGEPAYNWGSRHETMNFSDAGIISIILPQPQEQGGGTTILSDWADDLMDEIRALFGG